MLLVGAGTQKGVSPPYLFPTRGLPQPVQENTVRGNTPGNTQTRLRNTVVLAQEGGSFSLDESLRDAFFLASEAWREGRSLRRNSNDSYRIPLLAFSVNPLLGVFVEIKGIWK